MRSRRRGMHDIRRRCLKFESLQFIDQKKDKADLFPNTLISTVKFNRSFLVLMTIFEYIFASISIF